MNIYISTNGCVEGQLSSTRVEQFFRKNNMVITKDPAQADLIVFYACGLTTQREKDSLAVIRKLQSRMKSTARLLVWGCLPKINPQSLSTIYNGPIIGPKDIDYFEKIFEETQIPFDDIGHSRAANILVSQESSGLYDYHDTDILTPVLILARQSWNKLWAHIHYNSTFFIRVAAGCTGHCTYCSERCAFGRMKSRPMDKIISEFKYGLKHGHNRFSIIATDLGPYGNDIGCNLSDLLGKMIKIKGKRDYKIILNQLNPFHLKKMFSDLEEIFASGKIETLCSPVQSGSNRILQLMARQYTAEEWKSCMLRINSKFPDIRLMTQIMVGFPTETEEDFKATLQLLDYPLFLDDIVIFRFSRRPKVYASRIPRQVSEKTKELRAKKLLRKHAYMYALNFARRRALRIKQANGVLK